MKMDTVTGFLLLAHLVLVTQAFLFNPFRPFNQPKQQHKRYDDLRVRFSADPKEGYYKIPVSTSISLIKNYVLTPKDPDMKLPVDLYCYPNDPRVCFMYDTKGVVAGIQINYLEKDVANIHPHAYNYSSVGGYVKTNIMNEPGFAIRAYFTNPKTLTTDGRRDLSETIEGVWIELDGKLIKIQRDEPALNETKGLVSQGFYRQNCFPGMGQHYFYRMNPNEKCSDLLPVFALYNGGQLVGFGISNFGQGSPGPQRDWYERPPIPAIKAVMGSRPDCMIPWTEKYGAFSLHTFFVSEPWKISCNK